VSLGGTAEPFEAIESIAENNWSGSISCREDGSSKKVSLVATGALTNVALLLSVYPEIQSMIEVSTALDCPCY
jgi:inosine-uridine nucleoside N-ribohydrolase